MNRIAFLTSISILFFLLTSCNQDKQKSKKSSANFNSIITKGYEVDIANEEYSSGALRFMETEEYKNNILSKKTYYDRYEQIKGVEIYKYAGKKFPQKSFYYEPDGTQLSWYDLTYVDGMKTEAKAYEGESDHLLRIEKFTYSPEGYLISKSIYDHLDKLQKKFSFEHDANGNEVKMTVTDGDHRVILYEEYEIVEKDRVGRWLAKWGYVNGSGIPSTYQECSRSDQFK